MSLTITVFFGSYREPSNGERAFNYICDKLKARGHTVHAVNAKDYDLPFLDKMYKEYEDGQAPDALQKLKAIHDESDGYVMVTGEYNHSIQPGLSNILDYFLEEFSYKPSGIVSYSAGGYGGVRAAMQMRMMQGELGCPSIPSILALGPVQQRLDENGQATSEKTDAFADAFLTELEWYAKALKAARAEGLPA